ncbi:MAG TPA: retropepsin-like aspartic protease [Rhizomicrobium sp.]|nr:retropepsin-like aspartic protease [Rhizomicrobium sp.]
MIARIAAMVLACALTGAAAVAGALSVPFDFSRHAIGVTVVVKGKPLYFLLDTGVNPSVIDLARAEALGLKLDRKAAGEGNGEGPGTAPEIPATIPSPEIGGRKFASVEALATDMSAMSAGYGRALDGVLGYSFLATNSVLIDYPSHKLTIDVDGRGQDPAARCRKTYSVPFIFNGDDQFPVLRTFRFGGVEAPVTLDTGSNRTIGLYQAALQIPAIRKALVYRGSE